MAEEMDSARVLVIDCASGEAIERPLTAEELAERARLAQQAEAEMREQQARQAALDRLSQLDVRALTADQLLAVVSDLLVWLGLVPPP